MAERNPDFEIKQILKCLGKNRYNFGGVEESDAAEGFINAYFSKRVQFDDIEGNDVNDSHIIVKVEFDCRMDPEHSYYDDDNEYIPNLRRASDFISDLFDADFAGGKRKTKKNKSRRKNKKNKSKRNNKSKRH